MSFGKLTNNTEKPQTLDLTASKGEISRDTFLDGAGNGGKKGIENAD